MNGHILEIKESKHRDWHVGFPLAIRVCKICKIQLLYADWGIEIFSDTSDLRNYVANDVGLYPHFKQLEIPTCEEFMMHEALS